ncbi:MAG: 50S ribosomal protein L30 [bacterium]|nr:50S ribosomal protein L30 [Candidatus Sumerlaeota bacterium]
MQKKVRIKWVRSGINRLEEHRKTLRALGFTHLNQTVEHTLTPQIQGMINQVGYLCIVEEISG